MAEEMHPGLEKVLREMCDRVGADFDEMDFTEKDWFLKYQWTFDQEEDFIKWLMDQIKEDKNVREIFNGPLKTKKDRESAARMFVFGYGWKVKKDTEVDRG